MPGSPLPNALHVVPFQRATADVPGTPARFEKSPPTARLAPRPSTHGSSVEQDALT
ncbi:MAG: hypothetical protein IPJ77_15035 [Planctomycetes bacterium]|nr:hypothetical protein [Planctomycetota bacterium]